MRRAVLVCSVAIAGTALLGTAATAATATWNDVALPATAGTGTLSAIATGSGTSAMTIGTLNGGTAVYSWSGTAWQSTAAVPVPFAPSALAVVSGSDAWAGGIGPFTLNGLGVSLHWNGSAWQQVTYPSWQLPLAIAASPDGAAWSIAGWTRDGGSPSSLFRWTGSAWASVSVPAPAGTAFTSISARTKNDVWLGGTYSNGTSVFPIVVHYDGTTWAPVTAPSGTWGVPANQNVVQAIAAVSPTSVWALRAQHASYLLHYDGTSWQQIALPTAADPLSVAGDGQGGAWVSTTGSPNQATYLHWTGGQWVTATGPARSGATTLSGLAQINGGTGVWSAGGTTQNGTGVPFTERLG